MTPLLKLSMINDMCELPRLIDEAVAFLESLNLSMQLVYKTNLILEELLTNVLKYGFPDAEQHEIHVSLKVEKDGVVLTCVDCGIPFDPLSAPPPDEREPLIERAPGGLGIHLVRKTANSMTYLRDEDKNVVKIWLERGGA
jgi:anti-sigma regulatory factor (Ser/Thr protein kinase)